MPYYDSDMELLSKCCEGCRLSGLAEKIDMLVYDLNNDTAYSGESLSSADIEYLDGMCVGTENLGTILDNILTASQNYTEADEISDAVKNNLNASCVSFATCAVGTILQNSAVIVNTMTEYNEAVLKTFLIGEVEGTIDEEAKTVALELPFGTVVTNLTSSWTVSTGADVYVSDVAQESNVTANDFTNPVDYEIVGGDGETTETYTVTVSLAAE